MAFLHFLVLVTLVGQAAALTCSADSDCTAAPYGSKCDTGNPRTCSCRSGFSKVSGDCKEIPPNPTISLQPGVVANDLSYGAYYTLICSTTPQRSGVTFIFYQHDALLQSGTLSSVSAANNGKYKCRAILDNVSSASNSTTITIKVNAAGKRCTKDSQCQGNAYKKSCSGSRCECNKDYAVVGETCSAATKNCGSNNDCSVLPFNPTCDRVSATCNCAVGFEKVKQVCKVKPVRPTLTLEGNYMANDLSAGATYKFKCSTEGTSPDGTIYKYYKDQKELKSNELKKSTAKDDGRYTCKAVLDKVESAYSAGLLIQVGDAGKRCTVVSQCIGTDYASKCTNNRCDCKSGAYKKGNVCTSGAGANGAATVTLVGLFLAFVMSKLV